MPRLRRRTFLAAAASTVFAAPAILSARSPSEKLRLVFIGSGGRAKRNMMELKDETVVALCDVNEANLNAAKQQAPGAKTFRDFRKLYDTLRDDEFDAVVVSTTEHTHAFATLPALQRKKHVYCEKPLTHNIREARLITEAALLRKESRGGHYRSDFPRAKSVWRGKHIEM